MTMRTAEKTTAAVAAIRDRQRARGVITGAYPAHPARTELDAEAMETARFTPAAAWERAALDRRGLPVNTMRHQLARLIATVSTDETDARRRVHAFAAALLAEVEIERARDLPTDARRAGM